jgi:alanyl-tRNA synthetase
MKTSKQIREDFFKYWTEEPRNFKVVPNMSLVPNVDSTLLFVNSGMFPLAPYLGGQPHPLGKRLVNFQRCLRTNYDEMIEIGDNRHTLMFEMMGDWSLGDFFKKEQIPWILKFWVDVCGLDPKRIYVTVFEGDNDAPIDTEAIELWKEAFKQYGIEAELAENITDVPTTLEEGNTWKYRIFKYPKKKNWWERAHAVNELGGPTSEMFYDRGVIDVVQDKYHVNDDSGRFIEIGNNVFMQYRLDENLKWQPLAQKNIDFGGGFERIVMIVQGKNDIFETDIYMPIIQVIEELSGKSYKTDNKDNEFTAAFRVIADHSRAATFILADGVIPSNKDQGYILRRFIRRLVRFGKKLGIEQDFTAQIAEVVIETMSYAYPHLEENRNEILEKIVKEEKVFKQTLNKGLKIVDTFRESGINGKEAFNLYETYGFPLELTLDELKVNEEDALTITKEFKKEEEAHRAASRAGAEQKFKGGLADASEETKKLHTAHHLLLAALQKIVDPEIKQKGSNITAERLRIDFNLNRALTEEELRRIEELVNRKINENLDVVRAEMKREDAEQTGAQMEFGAKYPEVVSVYIIGNDLKSLGQKPTLNDINQIKENIFSMEFCGGPHVESTSKLAENSKKFKIIKQESSGAGIRRIKASLV